MKGLLLKDFYTSIKELRLYFGIMALFIAVSFIDEGMYFLAIYPCLICGMLPQSLMALDERSQWENYCGTLPISRSDIVSSKYIFTLIMIIATTCVSAIVQSIRFIISNTYTIDTYVLTIVFLFALSCITVALQLPLNFRYGPEKGRIGYYVMVLLASFGSVISGKLLAGEQQVNQPNIILGIALCIIALIFYGLSWLLSIKFYNTRKN